MKKTGIALLNIGTPEAPSTAAVRRYLWQFLRDPYVITLPKLPRYLLAALISMTRAPRSAALYQNIWQDQGSPLLHHSEALRVRLAMRLPDSDVVIGMRYGQPSIAQAIAELIKKQCHDIILLPMFPQYSKAATQSGLDAALKVIDESGSKVSVRCIKDFYDHPAYIKCMVEHIKHSLRDKRFDALLFSYHGLPVKHVVAEDSSAIVCSQLAPCPAITSGNRNCYRAQAYATSRTLAQALAIDNTAVSFQSRLGKLPWIQPYSSEIIRDLYQEGVRDLAVCCPSFTADCLETLEEVNIQLRESWHALGGQSFTFIPSLNAEDSWINSLLSILGLTT